MPGFPLLAPILLAVASMIGMMVTFMTESSDPPVVILLIGVIAALTLLNAAWLEIRRRGRHSQLPGWALPFAGTIGGLAACAQLAIYLANSLQEQPVEWFLHVPGIAALLAIGAALHVAWRG